MSLSQEDVDRIANAVSKRSIHDLCIVFESDAEKQLHEDQHEWLKQAIRAAEAKEAESRAKKAFWMQLLTVIIQYSIPVAIGSFILYITGQKPS